MADLVVNLEEFASLVGVTAETMRVHVREVEGNPAWLVERGDRGRGYKIEAEGGVAWWQAKKETDDLIDAERRAKLQQMRFDLTGGAVEEAETLAMSGRKRSEEYAAAMDAIKLRKTMGELVEKAEVQRELSAAAVTLRRRLQRVPGEFVIANGLDQALVRPLKTAIGRALEEFNVALKLAEAPDADQG